MHAVIEVASPDDITLIDLGNEPGTIVNGARVNKVKIHPGDRIQIGAHPIVLERAEFAAVASPPMPAGIAPPAPLRSQPLRLCAASPDRRRTPTWLPATVPGGFGAATGGQSFRRRASGMGFANPSPFAQDAYGVPDDAPPAPIRTRSLRAART